MRLLIHSTEFPPGPGGIGTHAYQVAHHLVRKGWEVAVVTPQDYASEDEIRKFTQVQPFPLVRLQCPTNPPLKALCRLYILSHWFRHWSPDVLLASGQRAVWLSALLAGIHQRPWAAVGHGGEFGKVEGWIGRMTHWAFGRADVVVCVSTYTYRRMFEAGIHPRKTVVIPNGADADTFRPINEDEVLQYRKRLGLTQACLLLTVGNLSDRKGQDVVIRAMPEILESVPNAHYLMVGLPSNELKLKALARQCNVVERVHFLGRLDAKSLMLAYNACDVYVMTSRHDLEGGFEGYGIAAVEAALCGKPAVVSVGSGLQEAVLADETGLLVEEDHPQQTAAAIIRLLMNAQLRRTLGERARRRALEEQTWEKRVAMYDRVLDEIAGENGTNKDFDAKSETPFAQFRRESRGDKKGLSAEP